MSESFHIRIEKERLVFSAAHFITFDSDVCEPLHGHNYHVAADVYGPLGEHEYVADFLAVRDVLQEIVDELDHRVLLPLNHPTILVEERAEGEAGEVVATHGVRRWVFPRQDCVLLPVANTTAERLAWHIGQRLLQALTSPLQSPPSGLRVAVDECDGQWGVYSWEDSEKAT